MPNNDHDDVIGAVLRPRPEPTTAERQDRERQQIFYSHEQGTVAHGPADSGPVHMAEVCVLNERGAHLRMGAHCQHFIGFDPEHVTNVEF